MDAKEERLELTLKEIVAEITPMVVLVLQSPKASAIRLHFKVSGEANEFSGGTLELGFGGKK